MPGTVETDIVTFAGATGGESHCDSITDWVGPTLTLDTELKVQGTGCLGVKVSNTTDLATFSISGTVNLSSIMVYFWAMFADPLARLATKSGNGLCLRIESSDTDYGEWQIAGKDTWSGGWKAFAQHTAIAFNGGTGGSVNKGVINKISIRWTTTATAKVSPNCYIDAVRYGTELRTRGGTEASSGTFQDFIDAEEYWDGTKYPNRWGVIEKTEGLLMTQGKLRFGSPTDGQETYFKDTSKILIFKEPPNGLPTDYYEMNVVGNATALTQVYYGSEVGGKGISGCIFSPAVTRYKFTATDVNITDLGVYGCTFLKGATISLPAYSSTREALNTNFEACAMVLLDTCTVENCNFISADDAGARVTDTTDPPRFKNSNFISCPYGTRIPNIGTYKFDNLKFSGSTSADIDNTSGGSVIVNCVNGANPTTKTGDTTINSYVDVTITVKDEAQANIEGAGVRVSKLDDNAVVYMNEVTDVNGVATESINYPGAVSLRIRIRKSSTGTRYIPIETTGVMTTTGFALTITLYKDGNL